jgi:hypothetical protein
VSDNTLLLVLDVFNPIFVVDRCVVVADRFVVAYRRRQSLRRYVERNQELLISYLSYRKMSYCLYNESSRLKKQSTGVFDRGWVLLRRRRGGCRMLLLTVSINYCELIILYFSLY